MANPSKAKGTRAETRVARYLTEHGIPTKRKALAGSDDEGDLRAVLMDGTEVAIEVKAGKQTANPSRSQMNEWKRQALIEARNCESNRAFLMVVRYNRRLEDAEMWTKVSGSEIGWNMCHLDEFAIAYGSRGE